MNNKQVVIHTDRKKFFIYWMLFTSPFHKLRPQERNVLAYFIYYYYEYKQKINDDKLLWKMVFNPDTKRSIKEELDIDTAGFQNVMTSFRKQNVLVKKTGYEEIKKSLIPVLTDDFKQFDLTYRLILNEKDKS